MIKLAEPLLGRLELEAVERVFKSGNLVQGQMVSDFEKKIAEYIGVNHAVAVSSGTAALHLSLLALGITARDEVVVPDFTFPATANVVEVVGAITRFVDIIADDCCLNPDELEKAINPRTKAVIVVQEFGYPAEMDRIIEICKKNKIHLIEDAACALGTSYKGKMVGSIGELGCFSLHPRKAITSGEGGIITTNNDELAGKLRILRNHGMEAVDGEIKFVAAGLNYRLTDIQGAIANVQFDKLEEIISYRRSIARLYAKYLRTCDRIQLPIQEAEKLHVYQSFHIIVDETVDRNSVIKKMRVKGVETNYGAYSVHNQPYYIEKYHYSSSQYKQSLKCSRQGIVLPMHTALKESDIKYIATGLRNILENM